MDHNNHHLKNSLITDDQLILVDQDDHILGYQEKSTCHQGEGKLHRAFSIFIFNNQKELLLQKRSQKKRLWPLFWSNSVCSHPRKGETILDAACKRVEVELGVPIEPPLTYLFKFQYQAFFKDIGSENELCSVLIGKWNKTIHPNPDEIADWKYINLTDLDKDINKSPHLYTPWFKMEWEHIKKKHLKDLDF
jgi:isopentenyl-diphosphate delta-isomerase